MINIKQNNFNAFLLSLFLFSLQANAYAEEGAILFTNKAFKQVSVTNEDGSTSYDYVEPGLVLPNDIMFYQISFKNISKDPVENIVIDNPIANNTSYRPNSARGESTEITFSVDGKAFAEAGALTVKDKTGKTWQAKPEDYTVIRWKYTRTLQPGEEGIVTYKTQIN